MKTGLAHLVLLVLTAGGPALDVRRVDTPFKIDGVLNERAYGETQPVRSFVVAGRPETPAARTSAWVFWSNEGLSFAFDCQDGTIIARPPTSDEHDVDTQDRVEIFLWSGKPDDTYYCVEVAPLGAVHDYSARFYRKFNDSWSVKRQDLAVKKTPGGYSVEGLFRKETLKACGFDLREGAQWRAGLFRADFKTGQAGEQPDWITWVDARTPQPDFHVAGSFGTFRLTGSSRTR